MRKTRSQKQNPGPPDSRAWAAAIAFYCRATKEAEALERPRRKTGENVGFSLDGVCVE